ncbi:MAG: sugar phosphate isomerase/epimerase [Candidatus Omnitrophota bacterium]
MITFGLSTSWNASKRKSGSVIVDEIKNAGFDNVELNFSLTADIVDEIASIVKRGGIKVSSLHNFCPIPKGVSHDKASPDYYSLASVDEDERKRSVHFTAQTINKAAELGAYAVVLHCGKVERKDPTRRLIELLDKKEEALLEFKKIREKMFIERESGAKVHFERLLQSLDELNAIAVKRDIILGIENRFYYMEMPSAAEISDILEKLDGSRLFYWHDVGHAQVWEALGILKHRDLLETLGCKIAGFHFHDVKGARDHLAPGCGDFDFSILKPYVNESAIKIIEAHQPATLDEVKRSKEYLNSILS